MSKPTSGTELLSHLSDEAQRELAEGEASVHHLSGRNAAVRDAWHSIGVASVRLRDEAMRLTPGNQPVGRRYNEVWKALAGTKPGLAKLDKNDRSHAMWLAEHWREVVAWLPTLGETTAATLLHPTSIMRRYKAAHDMPPKPAGDAADRPPSPRVALQDQVIKLQEENDLLRKKNGGGLMPSASVDELGELIRESHAISYRKRLIAKLEADIVKDERQDQIESKVRKPARTKRDSAPPPV